MEEIKLITRLTHETLIEQNPTGIIARYNRVEGEYKSEQTPEGWIFKNGEYGLNGFHTSIQELIISALKYNDEDNKISIFILPEPIQEKRKILKRQLRLRWWSHMVSLVMSMAIMVQVAIVISLLPEDASTKSLWMAFIVVIILLWLTDSIKKDVLYLLKNKI